MPFVADDLAAWLIGFLADASRKKLTTLVLGTKQERALLSAATAAVWETAQELCPGDDAQAEHVGGVISQVFRQPQPDATAKHEMLLESLRAGVAAQVAVLGDRDITTVPGLSSADALGIPSAVLTETLTGHLLKEILVQGSRGGRLFPLASQLNDDVTHLQGLRLEGMVGHLAEDVRSALSRLDARTAVAVPNPLADHASPPPGALLRQAKAVSEWSPLQLEVHRAVQVDDHDGGLPVLPRYVPRSHDAQLGEVVAAAANGASRIAVLVGGSSTGKTRACWEAVQLLPSEWRLWHPIAPPATKVLAEVGPQTVVWLNDAHLYLLPADPERGERVAARLRGLLTDVSRSPVLVLLTLWPEDWAKLTQRRLPGKADLRAQARELLAGAETITIPEAFSWSDLAALRRVAGNDRRLLLAADHADAGRITQYLAGVPLLMRRYRNAEPAARAVINVAIDARRMGHSTPITRALLQKAAPGYLSRVEWDHVHDDWLERALEYAGDECYGTPGPLTLIRPRPGEPEIVSGYALADYLAQAGRHARAGLVPPKSFWDALVTDAELPDLPGLADQAEKRGLYRYAALLDKRSIAASDLRRAAKLLNRLRLVDPDNSADAAEWIATQVTSTKVKYLEELLRSFGSQDHAGINIVASLIVRWYKADPQRLEGTTRLLELLLVNLRMIGDNDTIADLARQAVARVEFMQLGSQLSLAHFLHQAEADDASAALAMAAAEQTNPADAKLVHAVLAHLRHAHADVAVAALAARAAEHADLTDPEFVGRLLRTLHRVGDSHAIAVVLARGPAEHADPASHHVGSLLETLQELGAHDSVAALAVRISQQADPAHPYRVTFAVRALRSAAPDAAAALVAQIANLADITDPAAVVSALHALGNAGAHDAVTALLARKPAVSAALNDAGAIASLLGALRQSADHDAVTALLARNPAGQADLADSRGVAALLDQFLTVGADDQAAVLLARDPASHADPADLESVGHLLHALRRAGVDTTADALTAQAVRHVDPADTENISLHLSMDTHLSIAAEVFIASRPALHVDLTNTRSVARLLERLQGVQARDEVAALLVGNPARHAGLDDPEAVSELLEAFQAAGAHDQISTLLARNPIEHADLSKPSNSASLLRALRCVQAHDAVATLLDLDPATQADPTDFPGVNSLLAELDAAGAQLQASLLTARIADGGHFRTLLDKDLKSGKDDTTPHRPVRPPGEYKRFGFGREPDGQPARQWGWKDIL